MIEKRLYVDCNATTPITAEHYRAVGDRLRQVDANPSSQHASGRMAKIALEQARDDVARLIGVRSLELVFTSGATESNNLVIQGLAARQPGGTSLPHILVSAAEHPSVLDAALLMQERQLADVELVAVDNRGQVILADLLEKLRPETALACLIWCNNEVGTINPLADIVAAARAKSPKLHVHADAVQALGKLDVAASGLMRLVDSAAFSAHKIGAFKGIGALYLRAGSKLNLLVAGGGQERGRRPGTENMPGIVSFGLRAQELLAEKPWADTRLSAAGDRLLELMSGIPGCVVHGDLTARLPNTVNFHIEGVSGDDILINFDLAGIEASSGSACSSGSGRPSHVLKAMKYDDWVATNSVRVSFGTRGGTEEADRIYRILYETVVRVRSSVPGNVLEPRV